MSIKYMYLSYLGFPCIVSLTSFFKLYHEKQGLPFYLANSILLVQFSFIQCTSQNPFISCSIIPLHEQLFQVVSSFLFLCLALSQNFFKCQVGLDCSKICSKSTAIYIMIMNLIIIMLMGWQQVILYPKLQFHIPCLPFIPII